MYSMYSQLGIVPSIQYDPLIQRENAVISYKRLYIVSSSMQCVMQAVHTWFPSCLCIFIQRPPALSRQVQIMFRPQTDAKTWQVTALRQPNIKQNHLDLQPIAFSPSPGFRAGPRNGRWEMQTCPGAPLDGQSRQKSWRWSNRHSHPLNCCERIGGQWYNPTVWTLQITVSTCEQGKPKTKALHTIPSYRRKKGCKFVNKENCAMNCYVVLTTAADYNEKKKRIKALPIIQRLNPENTSSVIVLRASWAMCDFLL